MQGCAPANGAHDLHAGALAIGPFNINNFVALAHAQVDRLCNQFMQLAHGQQRSVTDIEPAFHQIAKFEQAHPEPVVAGMGSVNKPSGCQIIENPVGGGGVQPSFFADLLQRHGLFSRG